MPQATKRKELRPGGKRCMYCEEWFQSKKVIGPGGFDGMPHACRGCQDKKLWPYQDWLYWPALGKPWPPRKPIKVEQESDSEPDSGLEPDSQPESESESKPDSDSELYPEPEPEPKPKPGPEPEPDT